MICESFTGHRHFRLEQGQYYDFHGINYAGWYGQHHSSSHCTSLLECIAHNVLILLRCVIHSNIRKWANYAGTITLTIIIVEAGLTAGEKVNIEVIDGSIGDLT